MLHARQRATIAMAGMLALASASAPLMAQGAGAHARGGSGGRIQYLTGYLSLTDAQVTQAKAIFDAESAAAQTARGQVESAQKALSDAVKTSAGDATIDSLASALGSATSTVSAIHAKATVKFAAILTPDQKTKFFAMRDRQGPGGNRPFRGGGGRRPPAN
jgi:Spy/CpxP family protein refolding chaperone